MKIENISAIKIKVNAMATPACGRIIFYVKDVD